MTTIIGEIGPLKELKQKLHINNIEDFNNKYQALREEEIIVKNEGKHKCSQNIINMKIELDNEEYKLSKYIKSNKNIISKILSYFKIYNKGRKIGVIKEKINKLENNFKHYSTLQIKSKLDDIKYQCKIMQDLENVYKGAIGENKVVNNLKHINSFGILINDFNKTFPEPIFKKGGKDPIMSVQIDHIFINKAGIFLIETKNWSFNASKIGAYSPMQQADRHNTAFYRHLKRIFDNDYKLKNKSIPKIYNIVLFTGKYKQKSDDPFVKSLFLSELKRFIESKTPIINMEHCEYLKNKIIESNECVLDQ